MILILTAAEDPHADAVIEGLERRGAGWTRIDPGRFPAEAALSFACTAGGEVRSSLAVDGGVLDLERVSVAWLRRPEPPAPHPEIADEQVRKYVADECRLVLSDLWHSLDCRWVPALPSVIRRAELKGCQLKLAAALGFEVPATLLTNSPDSFLEFYREQSGELISKLATAAFWPALGSYYARYTEVVSRRDVGYADSIAYCPALFQAYVPKRVELRVTVVAERVFAAEIHSQASNHTRHDWRRYDRQSTTYLRHELPAEVEQRCLRLVERLGLCYGAIDLVLTPDGRYVFLEINPNGQYLWIEYETGLPITEAVCDLLVSASAAPERQPGSNSLTAEMTDERAAGTGST